jgi:hypothetical protein
MRDKADDDHLVAAGVFVSSFRRACCNCCRRVGDGRKRIPGATANAVQREES